MNKKKDIPNIRFDGFMHDWESDKLKKLASFSKGKGYTKSDLKDNGAPIILYGRLYTKYETVIESVDTFTNIKDMSVLSEGDEVIVPGSGETSEDIARASVISKSGIIIGGDLNVIKPTEKIESIFLALTISNGRQQKELSKRAQGNSVVHLYNSNLREVSISFPKKQEQIKISSFFSKIDNIIKLQQQLLNDHKQLKKAMLQKMFPQKGEVVPKVRFAGFTGAWEQRELKDTVEFYSGLTYSPENMVDEGTLVLRSSNVKEGEITDADNVYVNPKVVNSKQIEIGDIIVVVRNGSRRLIGKHAKIKFDMENTVIGAFMIGIKAKNPDYIKALLDTQQFLLEIHKDLGATINQITTGNFKKMRFYYPTIIEQEQVGNLFKQLDETIELHQNKLETYQELKKAMLQRMFV